MEHATFFFASVRYKLASSVLHLLRQRWGEIYGFKAYKKTTASRMIDPNINI